MELRLKKGLAKGWLGVLSLIATLGTASTAFALASSEYQLKAVFLFNFAQFVEWPESAFSAPDSPLRICVLGDDPFGAELEEVMQGETINGRALLVSRYAFAEDARDCHVLFVAQSSEQEWRETLLRLKGQPVLTVGETHGFTSAGGVIRFFTEGNRIRLEVNPRAADEAQLRLSSKLLRSSQITAQREG
jgi:hypothetical protein